MLKQKLVLPARSESEIMASLLEKTVEDEGVLWEMVSKVGSGVTESQKEQLFLMFSDYSNVFCLHPNDMGHTTEVKHHIDTGDLPPIHQSPRRIPHACGLKVKKLLKDMLKNNVIRPSNSPWSSPIILVQKKDGSTRFCVDYRKVNAVTRKDAYPMPRVDNTLNTLGGFFQRSIKQLAPHLRSFFWASK